MSTSKQPSIQLTFGQSVLAARLESLGLHQFLYTEVMGRLISLRGSVASLTRQDVERLHLLRDTPTVVLLDYLIGELQFQGLTSLQLNLGLSGMSLNVLDPSMQRP